jgi:ABC-2 type transport system permease protein
MFDDLTKIYYFLKRDALSFSTYKTNMILMLLGSLFGALSYAFLGSNATMQAVLEEYNMSLLTYLLIGVSFDAYIGQSLTWITRSINPWSLEEILVSPIRLWVFIIGSSLWGFILSTITLFCYLLIGILAFGLAFSINWPLTILVLALGILTFVGISMIGAGILIVNKQGEPITWLIGILTSVFGNVLFPPTVMPQPLPMISYAFPPYYFFTSIRMALTGRSIVELLPLVSVLALMAITMLPIGYLVFRYGLHVAKKAGTLAWY